MTVSVKVKSSKLKPSDLSKLVSKRSSNSKLTKPVEAKSESSRGPKLSSHIPAIGSVVSGEVTGSGERGVFVRLAGSSISGRIKLCDVSTRFITGKEVETLMPVGSTMSGLIVCAADKTNQRVDLKLQTRVGDPEVGSMHKAIVKRVEKYGVILTFPNSLIRCLCVPEEVHEDSETARALMSKMQPGHKYSVKVIKVEQGKIWASMKDSGSMEYSQAVMEFADPIVEEFAEPLQRPKLIDESAEVAKTDSPGFKRSAVDAMEDEDAEEAVANRKKANKRQRDAERQEKEAAIREKEQALLSGEWRKDPQTADEFERLCLEDKSAAVWIKYMSFWLKMTEVTRARETAERGLKQPTMSEQDKFNLWIAYLNMEVAFGNAAEEIFVRAAQYCDTKKIHHALPQVYVRAGHSDKAVVAFERMCAKFPQCRKAYMHYLEFLFNSDRPEDARAIFAKAMKHLPKHKQVRATTKLAQLEFRNGFPERGTTVFDQLLQSGGNMARTDIWSIFFDETIKANTPPLVQTADCEAVRGVFEKALSAKLKPKKMKSFFKRWLDFETKWGTDADVEHVKNRAVEYVESLDD